MRKKICFEATEMFDCEENYESCFRKKLSEINTVKPRNLLILGPSKIVQQIAKSADCQCCV